MTGRSAHPTNSPRQIAPASKHTGHTPPHLTPAMLNRKRGGVQGSGIFKANPGGGSSLPQVDSLQAFPRRVAPDSLELPRAFNGAPERVRLQLCLPGARCITAAFVRGWW